MDSWKKQCLKFGAILSLGVAGGVTSGIIHQTTSYADSKSSTPMIYDPQHKLNKKTVAHVKAVNNLMERQMNGQPEIQVAIEKSGTRNTKKSQAQANAYFNKHATHQFGWKNGIVLYLTTNPRTYQVVFGADLQDNVNHSKNSELITGNMAQYLAIGNYNKFVTVSTNAIYSQLSAHQIVKATNPKSMVHEQPKVQKRNFLLTYSFLTIIALAFGYCLYRAIRWYRDNRDRD